ncbi:hypothetical protein Trydic_g8383 [Trypoxylus dichotomus]
MVGVLGNVSDYFLGIISDDKVKYPMSVVKDKFVSNQIMRVKKIGKRISVPSRVSGIRTSVMEIDPGPSGITDTSAALLKSFDEEGWTQTKEDRNWGRKKRIKKSNEEIENGDQPRAGDSPNPRALDALRKPSAKSPAIYVYDVDFMKAVRDISAQSNTTSFQFKINHFIVNTVNMASGLSALPVNATVKYLSPSMDEKEIENALIYKGIRVKRDVNLKRRNNSVSSILMIIVPRAEIEATYKAFPELPTINVRETRLSRPQKARKCTQNRDDSKSEKVTYATVTKAQKGSPEPPKPKKLTEKKMETVSSKKKQNIPTKDQLPPAKKEGKSSVPQKSSETRKDSAQESQMINAYSDGEAEISNKGSLAAFRNFHSSWNWLNQSFHYERKGKKSKDSNLERVSNLEQETHALEYRIDIALIFQTWLKTDKKFKIVNLHIYRADRVDRLGRMRYPSKKVPRRLAVPLPC